jgi:hypothetical protein
MLIERRDGSETVPLQDVDLLNRLHQYFDSIDQHLRAGHGWFIFNAAGSRGARIAALLMGQLGDLSPHYTYYVVPWREFSLNAYLVEVELQSIGQQGELAGRAKSEFELASRICRDSMVRMTASDLLVLTGLAPVHSHELRVLDQTVERRYSQRRSTILVSPTLPQDLSTRFAEVEPNIPFWDRLFTRMYERALIAV